MKGSELFGHNQQKGRNLSFFPLSFKLNNSRVNQYYEASQMFKDWKLLL